MVTRDVASPPHKNEDIFILVLDLSNSSTVKEQKTLCHALGWVYFYRALCLIAT